MNVERRAFIFGAGAGAALVAAPKLQLSTLPLLHGDGWHDDTDALQTLIEGKPVKLAQTGDTFVSKFSDGSLALFGGAYAITKALNFTKGPSLLLYGATWFGDQAHTQDWKVEPMLNARGDISPVRIINCHLQMGAIYSEEPRGPTPPLQHVDDGKWPAPFNQYHEHAKLWRERFLLSKHEPTEPPAKWLAWRDKALLQRDYSFEFRNLSNPRYLGTPA